VLLHVVAYSDPKAEHREVPGMLDDYAATAIACLDAYEATADLTYFKFAQAITDAMIAKFYDPASGGFFDSEPSAAQKFGVLSTPRKPLQDSPTPAGNPMAVIALLRLHRLSDNTSYRDKAEQTLETFAGVAGQFGIFAATYGIAVTHFLASPAEIVIVTAAEKDETAEKLYAAAVADFSFNKSVVRLLHNEAITANLPPSFASTIPNLPQLNAGQSFAVVCSGTSCQPPTSSPEKLTEMLAATFKM
jgi:uncharacterized protein